MFFQLTLQKIEGEDMAFINHRVNDGMVLEKESGKMLRISQLAAGQTIMWPNAGWRRIINIKHGAHEQTDKELPIVDNFPTFDRQQP